MIFNDKEGVGACNPFGVEGGPRANFLTQTSKLIGIKRIPCSLVARIPTELAMLKEFTSGWIKNRVSNWDVKHG